MGSGHNILIGSDPWLPDVENRFVSTSLNESIASAPVYSLMVLGSVDGITMSWLIFLIPGIGTSNCRYLLVIVEMKMCGIGWWIFMAKGGQ